MANRPIFMPSVSGTNFVNETQVNFKWVPGMAVSQKKKNVISLHQSAQQKGIYPVLEISTKSQIPLGEALSAFNLKVSLPGLPRTSVEAVFQGSKVFQKGGPFSEFYTMAARDIRHDERLRASGDLLRFDLAGEVWGLTPRTAFYDWLYLNALIQNHEVSIQLMNYKGFTDIEFNPEKSINCQARSAALFVALSKRDLLDQAMHSREDYFSVILSKPYQSKSSEVQTPLF